MALTRRNFLARSSKFGLAASTAALWGNSATAHAMASLAGTDYKAVVLINLPGGNDGNNTIVPMDTSAWVNYAQIRGQLQIDRGGLKPLVASSGSATYGLHPALTNIASLYNQKLGMAVANIGSLPRPSSKADVLANLSLYPGSALAHTVGIQQWATASAASTLSTGWGGRMADYLVNASGSLPPVLSTAGEALFTVGKSVQAVAVQSGSAFPALSPALNTVLAQIAANESTSSNVMVKQMATVRANAMKSQVLIDQAAAYTTIKTQFTPNSAFCQGLLKIAQVMAGRSVLGASRQIFYIQQGSYDTHAQQMYNQNQQLIELDLGIGQFFAALSELGLTNQVLVCTHSDFARSMQANVDAGTDHGWGNHHFVLGGGITGGRIAGTMPDMDLGGADDYTQQGVWIPTTSVVQMTAGIAQWMGLNAAQIADVFPDLANFPTGALSLV